MITSTIFYATLFAVISSSASIAQIEKKTTYFCTTEMVGGLIYNEASKKWESAEFKVDSKYIIQLVLLGNRMREKFMKFEQDEMLLDYEVVIKQTGDQYDTSCRVSKEAETETVTVGKKYILECSSDFGQLKFNLMNNRFLLAYMHGYVDGKDDKKNTPSMKGGVCTKIQ